jgi:hypothetical protein
MKTFQVLAVGIVSLFVPTAAFATPTVANGSFEADNFGFESLGLNCGGGTLTGWTTQCSADGTYPWGTSNSSGYGPTPYGKQWVIVGDYGGDGSWIEQTDTGFTAGQTYQLNFALASEEPGTPGSHVDVSFPSGSSTADQIFTAPARGGNFWDTWAMYSMPFVATSTDVTFRLEGVPNAIAYDAGIDNVSISGASTPVPEPFTLSLFGAGLAGAVALRRRKKAKAA